MIFGGFAPNSSSAEILSKSLGSRTVMSGSVSKSKNEPSQSLQRFTFTCGTGLTGSMSAIRQYQLLQENLSSRNPPSAELSATYARQGLSKQSSATVKRAARVRFSIGLKCLRRCLKKNNLRQGNTIPKTGSPKSRKTFWGEEKRRSDRVLQLAAKLQSEVSFDEIPAPCHHDRGMLTTHYSADELCRRHIKCIYLRCVRQSSECTGCKRGNKLLHLRLQRKYHLYHR